MLSEKLLTRVEKLLSPIGVWPKSWNKSVVIFNVTVLTLYAVSVYIKNFMNFEGESIENAITLSNGGLVMVSYFNCNSFAMTVKEMEIVQKIEREFRLISTAFLYFLPPAVLVRFVMPSVQYAYVQIFTTNTTFELPPPMGLPAGLLGEIPVYVLESLVRVIMLTTLMGVSSGFILSTLTICAQFEILALRLENLDNDDPKIINGLMKEHDELLRMAKILNTIYSPYFFVDCCLSFINLTMLMFSLLAHNVQIENYLSEIPLLTCGLSQLFFCLYFGDRLIDATMAPSLAAYKSEWYGKSVQHQKKILFVIMRAQRPQMLTVGNGFMIASMLLFSQILQRAWGAFNILRTTIER